MNKNPLKFQINMGVESESRFGVSWPDESFKRMCMENHSIVTRGAQIDSITQHNLLGRPYEEGDTSFIRGARNFPVEFGRKWIVNCYRGGYVLLAAPENAKISDQHCVTESLDLHFDVFGESPKSYGADRGMWSEENIFQCQMAQVEKIGIQPKGKAKAMVSQKDYRHLKNRRAGIEPRIGHLKLRGLGKSRMKSDIGDLISGNRSALSYNLALLMRDMNLQVAN